MRILFYIDSLEHEGGAQRVMSIIANGLCELGHDVFFVCDYNISAREYKIDKRINRYYLNKGKARNSFTKNIERIKSLRSIIQAIKPHVSISFLAYQNIRLMLASVFLGTKRVLSVRNDPKIEFGTSGIKRCLIRWLYNRSDAIVFQTKEERQYFNNISSKKCRIILNPVDDRFFLSDRSKIDNAIVSFGRLEPQKNQKLLIEAFSETVDRFKNYKLYIYGEGYLRADLESMILENQLVDCVFLPGRIEDVETVLSHARLFVLSSNYEGLPNAVMEAMAVGVPVISTDCGGGGPKMLIKNGFNGLLVKCNDVAGMAKAMESCIISSENREKYSRNAKKTAEQFRTDRIIEKWNSYLNSIVE